MDRALRPAGRARRVDDHVRRLGVGLRGLASSGTTDGSAIASVPPAIPALRPGHVLRSGGLRGGARPARVLTVGACGDGFVRGRASAARRRRAGRKPSAVTSKLAPAVVEPARDRRRRVAGEDRHVDRAQPAQREDGDHRLGQQRQEDADAVARRRRPGARASPAARSTCAFSSALVRRRTVAVLAFPGERLAVGVALGARVDRRGGVVEGAAGPPARPLDAARDVEDLRGAGAAMPARGRRPRRPRTRPDRARRGAGARRGRLAGGLRKRARRLSARSSGRRPPGGVRDVASEDRPVVSAHCREC